MAQKNLTSKNKASSLLTSPILLACSGGIDSVFLLYYFSELINNDNLHLHACYVDHKLRTESVSESKFVDKICQDLGIKFHFASFDNDFWKDSRSNLEERARKERYRILREVACEFKCNYIATGHHLDDQVETLLMRIFDRGTGIKGLVGITSRAYDSVSNRGLSKHRPSDGQTVIQRAEGSRYLSPVQRAGETNHEGAINRAPTHLHNSTGEQVSPPILIRPLLHMSRAEIEKEMKGREFITDLSNNDTDIRRNHYRKNVIPSICASLGGNEFKKHLYDLSQNAQRELEFTKEMAKEFWERLNNSPDNQPGPTTAGSDSASLQPASYPHDSPLTTHYSSHLPITHHASQGEHSGSPLRFLPRNLIEKHSDNFWMTAFSYLFSQYRGFSHSTNTLLDIVAFIKKKEPANANYDPFVFVRNRDGVRIKSP